MPQDSGAAGAIGRVLSGRFRIVSRIGSGRFTDVFVAHDLGQSRRVIVKLLSNEVLPNGWATDPTLTRRFLQAAEQAASVTHPHITPVLDWGDSDLGLYAVSNYMEGGSLLGMLSAGHLLSPSQALMAGLEVSRALEHVHGQGFIHQDVRPSNILFDSGGRAHLADLGTSWVLTSSETAGTLVARTVFSRLDAVRYASPEQAQGLTPDSKSDVYSLVLVLTEALSGRVPFESDDPEYTQMAKMSRALDLTGQFGRLGRVLEQAGRPERADRPSANDLATGFLSAAESLSRPEPLPLVKPAPEAPPTEATAAPAPAPAVEAPPPTRDRPRRRLPAGFRRLLVTLLVLLAVAAAGFGLSTQWDHWFGSDAEPVPNLAGASEADLLRIETEFGWVLDRREQRQDGTVAGEVLRQLPQPGATLEQGETVTVWVSLGPGLVTIPGNLVGMALADAQAALTGVGLSVGAITERHDEDVVQGVVIEVDELFPEVEPGANVDLVVSLGPAARVVPAIQYGTPLAVAVEQLEERRLRVLEWRVADNDLEAGLVLRVEPPPGTEVSADSVVTVVVSDGPEQVRVPSLATLSVDDATTILEIAGLCLGGIDGPLDAEILATNPPGQTVVDHGTCVSLITRPEEGDDDETAG